MTTATKKKSAKKIRLQPLGDRVVIEREESEQLTAGGIVLPDSAKDKPARGVVVSTGETFKVNDQELLLMREDDILAILEG